MSGVDMVFVFPDGSYDSPTTRCLPNYGAGFVVAALQSVGIEAAQYTSEPHLTLGDTAEGILRYSSRVVGFTCFDTNIYLVDLLCAEIKRRQPNLCLVAGGVGATFQDDVLLKLIPELDVVVRGEAEDTTRELVPALLDGADLSSIPGVTYRAGAGFRRNPSRPLPARDAAPDALDAYPSPYLAGVIPAREGLNIGLGTSRGCRYHCAYCQFPAMFRYRYRTFSIDRVVAEMRTLAACSDGTGLTPILDDDLCADRERVLRLCRRLVDEGIRIPFGIQARPDHVDAGLLTLLRRAGLLRINFGLESANPATLRRIDKVGTARSTDPAFTAERAFLGRVREAVTIAKGEGVEPSVSIIIGLPGETEENARNTLAFVRSLDVRLYSHNVLWLLKGTHLWATAKRGLDGLGIEAPDLPYKLQGTRHPFDVEHVSRLENAFQPSFGDALPDAVEGLVGSRRADRTWFVILQGRRSVDGELCRWADREIPLSATFFLCDPEVAWPDVKTAMNAAYRRHRAGTVKFHGVRTHVLRSAVNPPPPPGEERTSGLQTVAYRDLFCPTADLRVMRGRHDRFAVSLDGEEDVLLAAKHAEDAADGVWVPRIAFDLEFLTHDLCRWSDETAPCRGLARTVVLTDSTVGPCLRGVVGRVGDSLSDLRERLARRCADEERARGCDDCAVRDACSRCPFPAPRDRAWYCELRRRRPRLGAWLRLLRGLRHVSRDLLDGLPARGFTVSTSSRTLEDLASTCPLELGDILGARRRLSPGIVTIRDGDRVALFDRATGATYRLDAGACAIFAALIAGLAPEALARRIADQWGERYDDMLETCAAALSFLVQP